ncbi:MAG: EamA family transporter [Syntrophobacteraceae bacterium]
MIVPPVATLAVLGGAALHAAWNVGIRGGANRRASTALLALSAALTSALILPFLPPPARAAWSHLAITAILHVLYFNLVAEAYSFGAVSLTYPVMRGTAPALTAAIATLGFGEHLGVYGWAGLLLVSGGVCLQTRRQGGGSEGKALAFALMNAIIIALYTVNDGIGTRLSHSPLAYALWTFVLPAIPAALILVRGRIGEIFTGDAPLSLIRRGVGGGLCSIASYALALWAMTLAPIGAVAALRETAMLFGVLFAWIFLQERPGRRALFAVLLIIAGAGILDCG